MVDQRFHNPFTVTRPRYPETQRAHYQRYARSSNPSLIDECPFPRMIDLWWAGMSLAVRNGLPPVDLSRVATVRFETGAIFDSDQWRIQFLRLIALHINKGDPEILTRPTEIMTIADGLAAAGVPGIVEMLTDGDEPPIWNLSNAVERMLAE